MLEQRALDFFSRTCPTETGDTLLVAVSGGPDSVALLHVLLQVRDSLGVDLAVAHLDHGIRGEEAVEDARFVSELAAELGLTLHRRRVDVPGIRTREGGSLEAVARRERYRFLEDARAVAAARWVVTGHTADDQVETFLANMIRGAGPRGLGGMLPVGPGAVCRPLLATWREEVLAYLEEHDVPYRVDPSNADLSLTRNRIRQELVPVMRRAFGPAVTSVLARESQLMNELDEFLSLEGERILKAASEEGPPNSLEIRLDIARLAEHHRVLARTVIRTAVEDLVGSLEELSLAHVDAVLDLADHDRGEASVHLPRGLDARREYGTLVLSLADASAPEYSAPEPSAPLDLERGGELRWGPVMLTWRPSPEAEAGPLRWAEAPERDCFDAGALERPVYLRGVRPGDRLEPLGMAGSQKLSDLLINRKVPRRLRTRVALLCDNGGPEGGERILWVVGQRRSRHAPVRPDTSQVVYLEAETAV